MGLRCESVLASQGRRSWAPKLASKRSRRRVHLLTAALLAPAFFFGCPSESPQTGGTEQTASPSAPSVPSASSGSPHTNRPPIVRSAKIVPVPVVLNGSAMVQVEAEDPDGDPVAIPRPWPADGHPHEGDTRPSP